MGRNFIFVRLGPQSLRFRSSPGDEEVRRESTLGRIQRDGFAVESQDGEASGSGSEMDFVIRSGADGVVSGLEPFQAGERKPAVRLEELYFMRLAPGRVVFLPGSILRGRRRREQREQQGDESQAGQTIPEGHEKVYRGRENAENEDEPERA